MGKITTALYAFNRGLVSRLALGHVGIERLALSAQEMTNWIPRAMGSMMLRPGLRHVCSSRNDLTARGVPFVYSGSDRALIELTDRAMRVLVDEVPISRPSVSSAVTNGSFGADLAGWTDADEAGAASAWATGGYLSLTGTLYNAAIRRQEVTVSAGDAGIEHALRIVVARGLVTLRVGSSAGGDDYIRQTDLAPGYHSLAFTPSGNVHIQLSAKTLYASLVESVAFEAGGVMEIPTPWVESALGSVTRTGILNVIFCAGGDAAPRRIERRGARSWSVAEYLPPDGPFRIVNTSNISLSSSALTGDVTLTASAALFRAGHVGALFRLGANRQDVAASLGGADQWSDPIKVTGTGAQRAFTFTLSGTWSATVKLQRSVGEPGAWTDVTTYSSNGTTNYNDGLDNQIIYYRLGIDTGGYTSGTAILALTYLNGSSTGVVRITGVSSSTSATAIVLDALGDVSATIDWEEGVWSDERGQPTAVALDGGRLWLFGRGRVCASIPDAFESFDSTVEGDSGPINRSLPRGASDIIFWSEPLKRMMIGAEQSEWTIRSTSLDEPVTPSNFNLKESSSWGSASVPPVRLDGRLLFTDASRTKILEAALAADQDDYVPVGLTTIVPEIGAPGFVRMAAQRRPETRVHAVRADGKVAVLVTDPFENIRCWILVETDGSVEDVVVLPATNAVEDSVYYLVARRIGDRTVRYWERWAAEADCIGGTVNAQADSYYNYDGASTSTITGLDHLEGREVVVWADGRDLSPDDDTRVQRLYTVTGGALTLDAPVSKAVIGLPYRARWKSTKLAYGAQNGTALSQTKRVDAIGALLADTHAKGLYFGPDFTTMDPLPAVEDGGEVAPDHIHEDYDKGMVEFPGDWSADSRVCLEARAPRPCTAMALSVSVITHER